jgi:hypothetical protein
MHEFIASHAHRLLFPSSDIVGDSLILAHLLEPIIIVSVQLLYA